MLRLEDPVERLTDPVLRDTEPAERLMLLPAAERVAPVRPVAVERRARALLRVEVPPALRVAGATERTEPPLRVVGRCCRTLRLTSRWPT